MDQDVASGHTNGSESEQENEATDADSLQPDVEAEHEIEGSEPEQEAEASNAGFPEIECESEKEGDARANEASESLNSLIKISYKTQKYS